MTNHMTINNALATLAGKEIVIWLVPKGAKTKFFLCVIVLELLFTVFFFLLYYSYSCTSKRKH